MDYDDRGLSSMPKLVGGVGYRRPPAAGAGGVERPPDPDDLPLESARTPEDEALAHELGLAPPPRRLVAVPIGPAHDASIAPPAAPPPAPYAMDVPPPGAASAFESGEAEHPNGAWTVDDGAATQDQAKSPRWSIGSLFRGGRRASR